MNIHANTIDSLLITRIPNIQVVPSNGSNIIVAFTVVLKIYIQSIENFKLIFIVSQKFENEKKQFLTLKPTLRMPFVYGKINIQSCFKTYTYILLYKFEFSIRCVCRV